MFSAITNNLKTCELKPKVSILLHKIKLKWEKYYYFVVLILYFLTIAWINPFGEFAVNDDWDFYTHVRNFMQFDFVKSPLIDSSFVLQGFLGSLWSAVFGLNFVSLKILTILVTVIFLFGVVRILNLFKLNVWSKLIILLTVLFNPFVFMSSLTFMTEMYFLTAVVWSVYFLLKYSDTFNYKNLTFSVIFAALSILVRQIGLLLFPAILVSAFILDLKQKNKIKWLRYSIYIAIFCGISALAILWPQYKNNDGTSVDRVVSAVKSLSDYQRILDNLFYFLPYLGFCLLPLGIYLFCKLNIIIKLAVIWLSIKLYKTFYIIDIFKFGNVLYPEGLMIKHNYIRHITLYDNIIFKYLLAIVVLISAFSVIISLLIIWKKETLNKSIVLLVIALFLTIPILAYNSLYDRYLVNGLIILSLLMAVKLADTAGKKSEYSNKFVKAAMGFWLRLTVLFVAITTVFYVVYSATLNQDFFVTTRLQWEQAANLKKVATLKGSIFLSDTYLKFGHIFNKKNDPKLAKIILTGENYQCFSQKLVLLGNENSLYTYLFRKERKHSALSSNPVPFGSKNFPGFRLPTLDEKKIFYKEETFSLQEMLVGNRTYVETYCNN